MLLKQTAFLDTNQKVPIPGSYFTPHSGLFSQDTQLAYMEYGPYYGTGAIGDRFRNEFQDQLQNTYKWNGQKNFLIYEET